jgi:hypothetical protein
MRPRPFANSAAFFQAALRSQFEYDVVLPRVLYHFKPEIVFWSHFSDRRMIDLQGFDLLREIRCVSPDVDDIANAQRSARFELHDRN